MKCAFYEKEITPPLGSDIPGYYIPRLTEDVVDRLFARAVVFAADDADPAKALAILTLDAVNCPKEMADAIKARITALSGIPYERIAVIANHSHYGIPHGGGGSDRDDEYMALLPRLAADAVVLAFKRLRKCTLRYGMGQESRCAFVRDCVLDNGVIVTNPGKFRDRIVRTYKEADPDLPVLTAYGEDGAPLGVLFTFALHQDTVGGKVYSGDYSSEIAHNLKAKFGAQFGSVYVPGFCGDINHADFVGGSKWNHRSIGKLLAADILEIMDKSEPVEGDSLDVCYRELILQHRRATEEQIAHCKWVLEDPDNRKSPYMMLGSKGYKEQLYYEECMAGKSNDAVCPLQIMRLGDVWFFITPYEVYSAYAQPLKALAPGGKWLMSEMANTDGSYIPTPELMDTDIYPAWLCYGSWLEVEAGNKIVAELKDMAASMQ